MNKLITMVLFFLFPGLLFADSSISFSPPVGDLSVVFLANLFGVVDGVLSGTGSQIMGSMFSVFNSAVLALGGIIVMYTLLVSTMNTAHEGQMLGQKWSSIWIPVRATVGLALLIPKASGYCLMQIFVMWVVLQGIGAADAIWGAALSYLARGGVIVQQQQINPASTLLRSGNAGVSTATTAVNMLVGQVCMLGLETQLKNYRKTFLDQMNSATPGGPCGPATPTSLTALRAYCDTPVPDFLSTVDTIATQQSNPSGAAWSMKMPNFASGFYAQLNGICGSFSWGALTQLNPTPPSSFTPSELLTAQQSRATALQQMYNNLSDIARVIVGNAPAFASYANSIAPPTNLITEQFGIPLTQASAVCTQYSSNCVLWGSSSTGTGTTLFNGTEFINAINAYNGIMLPTLNYIQQLQSNSTVSQDFKNDALSRGWIMAGSYFYNLLQIQGASSNSPSSSLIDSDPSVTGFTFIPSSLSSSLLTTPPQYLAQPFQSDLRNVLLQIETLIDGVGLAGGATLSPPILNNRTLGFQQAISEPKASTVFGYITNSLIMQLPNDTPILPLTFPQMTTFSVPSSTPLTLQDLSATCNSGGILDLHIDCIAQQIAVGFYNVIIVNVFNFFIHTFSQIISGIVYVFVFLPMQGMSAIFSAEVSVIATNGANPISSLAHMGINYINFSGDLWMELLTLSITTSLIPFIGIFIFALLTLAMPLLLSWVGVMVSIGFTTAYFIPLLPYIIFTFGAMAWLIAVVEAMVAAPIVALGVTHPEGHEAFGKGEAAIMIMINVFLRPSLMIIGYIAGIALSFVGVWMLNAGYLEASGFISSSGSTVFGVSTSAANSGQSIIGNANSTYTAATGAINTPTLYTNWAGMYAYFFGILTYTTMYLVLVQKAFTLISVLPDKVLRWIGGGDEHIGQESAGWAGDVQKQHDGAASKTSDAQGQMQKQLTGTAMKGIAQAKKAFGQAGGSGSAEASKD